jgi:ABC-type Mn2+/Zn2+ transport system permease subunit
MSELFSPDFLFRNALLGGLGVALLCSALGIYLVLRRLVLIGVALPQASAAGIAAVFWLSGHAHTPGSATHLLALAASLGATALALAFLVAARRRGDASAPAEWSVGALYAVTSTATILFVAINPSGDLEMSNLLRGELLAITPRDLVAIGIAAAIIAACLILFRRELLLASFDPEFARTIGRNPLRADALLYGLLGGGIALGVMNVGPLVVFGYLVLPALAALRIAPGIASAFALAAAFAAVSFLGGFAMAYHADLPAGPTGVALAAALWLVCAGAMRIRTRSARVALLAAALALLAIAGCGHGPLGTRAPQPLGALPPGSLPSLAPDRSIAVVPFANDTGQDLHLASTNPLRTLRAAAGDPFVEPTATVPDALQERAAIELARRGYAPTPLERVRDAVPHAAGDPLSAAKAAQNGGLTGYVLYGKLLRFTRADTGLLLVRLDLWLIDPATEEVLWKGAATRPVAITAAQTDVEVVIDAGGPIFAEAFGTPR